MRGEFFEKSIEGDQEIIGSLKELRGDLHSHSLLSREAGETRDLYSVEQLAQYIIDHVGARLDKEKPGLEYFSLTEHGGHAIEPYHGIDEESGKRLLEQKKLIEKLNKEGRFPGLTILAGVEVNIFPGGQLDISDDVLKEMDIVVASRHRKPIDESGTDKIAALKRVAENPCVDIFGHPEVKWWPKELGLGPAGWSQLIEIAKQYDKAIEINVNQITAYPPEFLKMIAESGVRVSFGSDTHDEERIGLDENMGTHWREFVKTITRMKEAGIKKSQIINCLPLEELRRWRQERIKRFEKK